MEEKFSGYYRVYLFEIRVGSDTVNKYVTTYSFVKNDGDSFPTKMRLVVHQIKLY